MPASRRFVAATVAAGLLLTGISLSAAAAEPFIPGTPTPLDEVFAEPTTSASTSASATPAATSTATATATPTTSASPAPSPTSTVTTSPSPSPKPTPTPVPTGTPVPGGGFIDADGLFSQPRKKCFQFPDDAGDASTNPISGGAGDTDDDLDLTGVVYKTGSKNLQVFLPVTALDDFPTSLGGFMYDTHSFGTAFTIDRVPFELSAAETGPATVTVRGAASTAVKATATFDKTFSNIVFTVPRDDLASAVGHSITGADMTALTAVSNADSSFGFPGFESDDAAPTTVPQRTYVIGDNTCFRPAPAVLAVEATKAVYTDITEVAGELKTADGDLVQGATVTLRLPGQRTLAAKTGSDGVAVFRIRNTLREGSWTASMAFAGTTFIGPGTGTGAYRVFKESTQVATAAGRGLVIATASDNDRTRIANHLVTFVVKGKRYNIRTNAHGHAVMRGLTKGQPVTVYFASVRSLYYASKAVNAKAA